jgi:hypothetical protein
VQKLAYYQYASLSHALPEKNSLFQEKPLNEVGNAEIFVADKARDE